MSQSVKKTIRKSKKIPNVITGKTNESSGWDSAMDKIKQEAKIIDQKIIGWSAGLSSGMDSLIKEAKEIHWFWVAKDTQPNRENIACLLNEKYFVSQFNQTFFGSSKTKCFKACQKILADAGFKNAGSGGEIHMSTDGKAGSENELSDAAEGIKSINQNLEAGKPVILGVNYKEGSGNRDHVTDHFIVIVGKGLDKNGVYYLFWDPGVFDTPDGLNQGTNSGNKLYLKNNLLIGSRANSTRQYTSSWLRL